MRTRKSGCELWQLLNLLALRTPILEPSALLSLGASRTCIAGWGCHNVVRIMVSHLMRLPSWGALPGWGLGGELGKAPRTRLVADRG